MEENSKNKGCAVRQVKQPQRKSSALARQSFLSFLPGNLRAPPHEASEDSPLRALLALCAACALASAVQVNDGMYAEQAMPFLLVAFALTTAMVALPTKLTRGFADEASRQLFPFAAAGSLGWQLSLFLVANAPAKFLNFQNTLQASLFGTYLAFLAVMAARLIRATAFERLVLGFSFLFVFSLLGLWLLQFSPNPDIDVVMVHRLSLDALWQSKNPYSITFPAPAANHEVFGPGMIANGRLMFGYPYPPLNLLLALPAHLLGDYRGALLASMLLCALAMSHLQRQSSAWCAGCLLLLSPRILYQLEMGWTEPVTLALIVGVAWAHRHAPRAIGPLLGLLLASKQYVFLMIGTAALLPGLSPTSKVGLRVWLQAAATGLVVSLPFILWSPTHFWHDLVTVQLNLPFRSDALNFSGWVVHHAHTQLSSAWGFVAACFALLWCLWRMPRTRAGFCLSFAYVLLCFITFNRQAYANYYFVIQGALLAGFSGTSMAQATSTSQTGDEKVA